MTARNTPADVRIARLQNVVGALVLTHPSIPAGTRKRMTETVRAMRMLITVREEGLARIVSPDLDAIIEELLGNEIGGLWADKVKALNDYLRQVL